jgi:hypothetical protein
MSDEPKIIEVDCIRTKCVSLIDDFGRERAILTSGTKENDYVIFHMNDAEGRPRVTIELNASGSSLTLWTEMNAPGIGLSLQGEKANGIQIGRPGDGLPQIMLGVPGKEGFEEFGGEPSLMIINSRGQQFAIGPDN